MSSTSTNGFLRLPSFVINFTNVCLVSKEEKRGRVLVGWLLVGLEEEKWKEWNNCFRICMAAIDKLLSIERWKTKETDRKVMLNKHQLQKIGPMSLFHFSRTMSSSYLGVSVCVAPRPRKPP